MTDCGFAVGFAWLWGRRRKPCVKQSQNGSVLDLFEQLMGDVRVFEENSTGAKTERSGTILQKLWNGAKFLVGRSRALASEPVTWSNPLEWRSERPKRNARIALSQIIWYKWILKVKKEPDVIQDIHPHFISGICPTADFITWRGGRFAPPPWHKRI